MPTNTANVVRINDVLLGTFPDNPTDETVDELQAALMDEMEIAMPDGVVLDISGVGVMDSFFARHVSETGRLIDLMGGTAVVAGMRPGVAITAAELGYDLDVVETARSTDQALEILGVDLTQDD